MPGRWFASRNIGITMPSQDAKRVKFLKTATGGAWSSRSHEQQGLLIRSAVSSQDYAVIPCPPLYQFVALVSFLTDFRDIRGADEGRRDGNSSRPAVDRSVGDVPAAQVLRGAFAWSDAIAAFPENTIHVGVVGILVWDQNDARSLPRSVRTALSALITDC